jgi:hypothetical protein
LGLLVCIAQNNRPEAQEKTMQTNDNHQTQQRGQLADEYEIYKSQAEQMGWPVKSFDDWLNS